MSSEGDSQGDKDRRIAELEQEVARLKARVDGDGLEPAEQAWMDGDPGDSRGDPASSAPSAPTSAADEAADQRELARHIPSRRRAIIIAVAIGIIAFVAIAAIVTSLSGVIEPLSKSAAGALEPFEPAATPTKAPPAKAAPDPLRVPGL